MPAGRPSKLTPARKKKLLKAIRLGSTYKLACQYAGVHYATFRRWLVDGEKAPHGQYREFYDAVKEAEGLATVQWLDAIDAAAADGSWQAAAWKLERRYPKDWGRRQLVEIEKKEEEKPPITPGEYAPVLDVPPVVKGEGE